MVVTMTGVVPGVVPMVVPMVRLGLLFDKWLLIRFLLFGAIWTTVSIRQHPQRSRFKPFGQQARVHPHHSQEHVGANPSGASL